MTAPALVLLADGSAEPSSTQVAHALRKRMQELRPGLSIHLAFLADCAPTPQQVVSTLIARGVQEAVFVPLDITHATEAPPAVNEAMPRIHAAHPGWHASLARPLGPACELLSILDLRLRQALSASHTMELDGLVLSAVDGGDPRGSALLARRARQWKAHHRLPVQLAFGDQAGHGIGAAMGALRTQGRRLIAVGSFYLSNDHAFAEQAEQALALGAVAVSAPIGADERLLDLAMARYSVAALGLLDDEEPPVREEADTEESAPRDQPPRLVAL